MLNWDTYPHFTTGGVYTWEKNLIETMTNYEFIVVNQVSNPNCTAEYKVPKHVSQVIEIPIYGCTRLEEYCKYEGSLIKKILLTNEGVIKKKFMPLYRSFINLIFADQFNPQALAETIVKLHNFLLDHDGKKCLEHTMCWEIFTEELNRVPVYRNIPIKVPAMMIYQMIQRTIQVLAIKLPKVDLIHCSFAWIPSIIAVYAKSESKCPVVVTEHGVAYREILLFHNAYMYDEPSKLLSRILYRNFVRLIYYIGDSIMPVCNINKGWEEKLGVPSEKIKVVYNGINTSKFKPLPVERKDKRPTIVTISRLVPVKDIICLIEAVKYAKEEIPDLYCQIYGSSPDLEHSRKCIEIVKEWGLEDNVKFMGLTKEPEKAFNMADIVVMVSITEGFPFTVIEAMSCGKAVIASDVGGVREALQGCGVLVRSRRPVLLSQAIINLFRDERLRQQFEQAAAKKVRDEFTIEKCCSQYIVEFERLLASQVVLKDTITKKELILE